MLTTTTHRPRNVDSLRAASILYGDLGTSKAYVIGLAFAIAGYSSFWLVAAVSLLTILVGINYIIICRLYPNGGGVYASVRNRSRIISMIGAFFLVADYLVTAALSSLSAFSYLGVNDPILWSACFIGIIGGLNYFGPRHTGTLAFIIGALAILLLVTLAIFSVPFLQTAWQNVQPLQGTPWTIWKNFVGVVVALSGIEAIANATGVMKLDPGTTESRPLVTRTSSRAILSVIIEVAFFTALFSLATAAISGFEITDGTVNAPGNPNVRDYMLKYLAQVFGASLLGSTFGHWFGVGISLVLGILLLSAVNTAINGLVALQYIMAADRELPSYFEKLNRFGVPRFPLLIATAIPIVLVVIVKDIAGLAALYAIGFVGAIATNLGSTSTDFSLDLKKRERLLMFFTFLIMLGIEITLFIDKPPARLYALAVIVAGLLLRGLSLEAKERKEKHLHEEIPAPPSAPLSKEEFSLLCVTTKPGKALQAALEKSAADGIPLHLLYAKEQEVIAEKDLTKTWEEDSDAITLMQYAIHHGKPELLRFYYSITDSLPDIVVAYAMRLEAKQIILELPSRGHVYRLMRGNIVRRIRRELPTEIRISLIT